MDKIALEDGEHVYQCQALKQFSEAEQYFERMHADYCVKISECIQTRLEWSDMDLFRDIIVMLATQGWQKLVEQSTLVSTQSNTEEENMLCAVDRLVQHFKIPLESVGVDTTEIRSEFEALIGYAAQFMSLSTMDYQSVWW
jgi:hypothetical protein